MPVHHVCWNSFIILGLFWFSSTSVALMVYQTPQVLHAEEGDSVTMFCSWDQEKGHRVRVHWFRDSLSEPLRTEEIQQGLRDSTCTLSIAGVTPKDAGKYYCSVTVEIPAFERVRGSGTTLTVNAPEKYAQAVEEAGLCAEEVAIFILRCLPFLALLMGVFYLSKSERTTPAPENRVQEDCGKDEEEEDVEDEALNEPATSLLRATVPGDSEEVDGRVSCPASSSDVPNQE